MKNRPAAYLLICAMLFTQPAAADEFGDMMSIMFRMMLAMMGSMSNVMNSNNTGWGGNPLGLGMTSIPLMSGMSGLNPWSGIGGLPLGGMTGLNPWTGVGGLPLGGMTGLNPWTGAGGLPLGGMTGLNPWSGPGGNPFSGGYNPTMFPGSLSPFGDPGYGYPSDYGRNTPSGPYPASALLNGRWYGNMGQILEVRGNQFSLRNKLAAINGKILIRNNIVNLIAPQTGDVTQYRFVRDQYQLRLTDTNGRILVFYQRPQFGGMGLR